MGFSSLISLERFSQPNQVDQPLLFKSSRSSLQVSNFLILARHHSLSVSRRQALTSRHGILYNLFLGQGYADSKFAGSAADEPKAKVSNGINGSVKDDAAPADVAAQVADTAEKLDKDEAKEV